MIGHQRLDANRLALFLDQGDLGFGIGGKAVDRNHGRQAEFLHVFYMALKIGHAGFKRLEIFRLEVFFFYAAVHLQGADGGDQHDAIRRQAGLAAFDVEEFLGAEVGAEAGFGHHVIGELERGGRRRRPSCSHARYWRRGRHG